MGYSKEREGKYIMYYGNYNEAEPGGGVPHTIYNRTGIDLQLY